MIDSQIQKVVKIICSVTKNPKARTAIWQKVRPVLEKMLKAEPKPARKQKLDFSTLYGEKGGAVYAYGDMISDFLQSGKSWAEFKAAHSYFQNRGPNKAPEASNRGIVNTADVLAKVLGGKAQKPNSK